jgi:hypothetical protein
VTVADQDPYHFADWRSMLSAMQTPDERLSVFQEACDDIAKQVAAGRLDKATGADQLANISQAYGLVEDHGQDEIQRITSKAFADAEKANSADKQANFDPRFKLTRFDDIKVSTAPNYLVKNILPREGLAVFWGPPKCCKSFLLYDISMHVALGWNYRNHKVKQGAVVYLALEGGIGFHNRVEAWRRRHLQAHDGDVPFYLLTVPVDLIADHQKLIAAIKA